MCVWEEEAPLTSWLQRPMTNRPMWLIKYGPPVCHTHHFLHRAAAVCLCAGPRGTSGCLGLLSQQVGLLWQHEPIMLAQMKWNVRKGEGTHVKLNVLTPAGSWILRSKETTLSLLSCHHSVWPHLLVKVPVSFSWEKILISHNQSAVLTQKQTELGSNEVQILCYCMEVHFSAICT